MKRVSNPKTKLIPTTIGLDVSDKQSHFCSLADDGEVVARGQVRTTKAALQQYFSGLAPSRIALEAGTHSMWIERLAKSFGHETIMANAREVRKIHQNDRKTDRTDAEILARIARVDPTLLCPITHRDADMQNDLAVIRARDVLVRARAQCVNAARGLVKASGGRLHHCSTPAFVKKASGQLPDELRSALAPMFATITSLTEQIRAYDRQVEELAKKHSRSELLRKISGVGALTSVAYILTIGDPTRFRKSRNLGPYLGIVPRKDDSGDRISQLPIAKTGNDFLRALLVQSSQYILGHYGPDCMLQRYGKRIAATGSKNAKKRAVIAVARKLSVLMHRLLVTGELYNPFHTLKEVSAT